MIMPLSIKLLAVTNNEKGDLFTRLAKDLFFALGYDDLHLDTHKAGRELDIQGLHRCEPRRVVAECKAHASKMGGAELNKFFGVLTRERKKYSPTPVAGYFISLNGFTESGVDQENETDDDRIILIDSQRIIRELELSRLLVGHTDAAERAGHCAQYSNIVNADLDGIDLFGHECGYIWAVYYSHGKVRTHFALIHADGTPLAAKLAQEIIHKDLLCQGILHKLHLLTPPMPSADRATLSLEAVSRYKQWLGEECGYIQLDGLPADTDLSATRLKLERLFVPLKANLLTDSADDPEVEAKRRTEVHSIGEIFSQTTHVALLATPGGGKSTLLKRLAIAYAFPARRTEVADDLPENDWLPLFFRCRDLRDRAHRPILELLQDLPRHAGMNGQETTVFQEFVYEKLRSGNALLLIDGLDEISDEGARCTFAQHLRSFLAMFPKTASVVTSREAGFSRTLKIARILQQPLHP